MYLRPTLAMPAIATRTVSAQLRREINAFPEGEVFDYRRFGVPPENRAAVVKALGRMVKSGVLIRLQKGKYYKARNTRFGKLRPSEHSLVMALTTESNRLTGYITGTALYHAMGLTTQVPQVITIARNTRMPEKSLHGYVIRYVIRPFPFTRKDVPFLQLLDACKDIESIPDVSTADALAALMKKLAALSEGEYRQLARLALQYNPATRALVGAMLQQLFPEFDLVHLRQSLNPLTRYKRPFAARCLVNARHWHIE